MYLVAIAWIYITLMMAVAEAFHPQGSLLGAFITFVFYGLAPLALVLYLLNTPGRRRRLNKQLDADAHQAQTNEGQLNGAITPNAGGESTTDAISPMGKK
jgi:membrane protein implicated in regulation of membrane protease activity